MSMCGWQMSTFYTNLILQGQWNVGTKKLKVTPNSQKKYTYDHDTHVFA